MDLLFLSGGLRPSTGTTPSGTATTPSLALEAAGTGAALAALAVLALSLEPSATAVRRATTVAAAEVATSIGISFGAALLDDDALAVDGMGIGGYCCLVTGGALELDESAVLWLVSVLPQ